MPNNTPWTQGKKASAIVAGTVPLFASMVLGAVFRPGSWYKNLNKSRFSPPGWVFAIMWLILYPLLGVGMVAACYGTDHPLSWALPIVNILVSLTFSVVMFGMQSIFVGGFITLLCLLMGIGLVIQYSQWNRSTLATWFTVPYVLWLLFASILAWQLVIYNRGGKCSTTPQLQQHVTRGCRR